MVNPFMVDVIDMDFPDSQNVADGNICSITGTSANPG
jgi:hypothetical protein